MTAIRYIDFESLHKTQLQGIPRNRWKTLFRQLYWDEEPCIPIKNIKDPITSKPPKTIALLPLSSWDEIQDDTIATTIWIAEHKLTFCQDGGVTCIHGTLSVVLKQNPGMVDWVQEHLGHSKEQQQLAVTERQIKEWIWLHADAYSLTVTDEKTGRPRNMYCWFVPEETFSMMGHSDSPSVESCLFFDMIRGKALTVFWPTKDLETSWQKRLIDDMEGLVDAGYQGLVLTRDYLSACKSMKERQSLQYAWFPLSDLPYQDEIESLTQEFAHASLSTMDDSDTIINSAPRFTLPKRSSSRYKVYSPDVAPRLFGPHIGSNKSKYELTCNMDEADIIWTANPVPVSKLESNLSSSSTSESLRHVFVNHVDGEQNLVVKDLLQQQIYKTFDPESASLWYPRTYNLNTHTHDFIKDYLKRSNSINSSNTTDESAQSNQEFAYILKPWNGTRSEGVSASTILPEILKQMATGPKLVSHYIHPPALLDGKKFDLRILVLIDALDAPQLRIYTIPSVVYARVANVEYDGTLNDLEQFEKHFTVMTYRGLEVAKPSTETLIQSIEQESNKSWSTDLLPKIHDLIKKAITAGLSGTTHTDKPVIPSVVPHQVSLVGADILFDANYNPFLLEFSATPDTTRVLEVIPDLYERIFDFLFQEKNSTGPSDETCLFVGPL